MSPFEGDRALPRPRTRTETTAPDPMKHLLQILLVAIIAMASLPSCSTTKADQSAELAKWANIAITAAELGGQINPKQAATIRKGGQLLLDLSEGKDFDLTALSAEAVAYAVDAGKLTPEQAAALQAAGTVALTPATPMEGSPVNPFLPAP